MTEDTRALVLARLGALLGVGAEPDRVRVGRGADRGVRHVELVELGDRAQFVRLERFVPVVRHGVPALKTCMGTRGLSRLSSSSRLTISSGDPSSVKKRTSRPFGTLIVAVPCPITAPTTAVLLIARADDQSPARAGA
ncbi:hypothetical protein V5P93_004609 [Actinokineospora auranticolor]|uniref:hypothetical protein n=1 Tax=Actinokineospora auranticolor TaxID=155976 RepID=UPI0011AFE5E7|nr:hypothetical protein [Actinokineospora auranticolor]